MFYYLMEFHLGYKEIIFLNLIYHLSFGDHDVYYSNYIRLSKSLLVHSYQPKDHRILLIKINANAYNSNIRWYLDEKSQESKNHLAIHNPQNDTQYLENIRKYHIQFLFCNLHHFPHILLLLQHPIREYI